MTTMRKRNAFSLIEVVIAAALGVTVIGTGLWVYLQGNKMFYTTTEHASFRETAQLLLDHVQHDIDQLIVSADKWPDNSNYIVVEPFKLVDIYDQGKLDPTTNEVIPYTKAGSGVEFYAYSHTETGADGKPKIIGRVVHYETVPIDPADLSKGVNLIRNGDTAHPVNQTPLSEVIFQKLPPNVAQGEVGASPNAVLKVTVIPEGGMWKQMRDDTISKLKEEGTILTRVYHLSGFESQYTANVNAGLSEMHAENSTDPSAIDNPVVRAITADAITNGGQPVQNLANGVASGNAAAQGGYVADPSLVKVENTPLDDKAAATYVDSSFANAEEEFIEPDPEGDAEVPETIHPSDKGPFPHGWSDGQPNHCPAVPSH